ncbi:hypothetical protein, partial [Niastella vici]|uniref:hypothetical protein n=1 Tax=Niastella vici TaxID=1703345 RepID=UPI001301C959
IITVASTGLTRPSNISCDDLVKTYKNFIAEFPNHTKGATVRVYMYDGGNTFNSPGAPMDNYVMANHKPGPNVPDFMAVRFGANFREVLKDTTKPGTAGLQLTQDTVPVVPASNMMVALAALPGGYWTDVTMDGKQLFEWYMNQHFNAGYSYLHYADWLVNGCGYKLNQLPWSDTVAVRADTLQNIWNRFVARYPVSQTSITETVTVPVMKGVSTSTIDAAVNYSPEWLNAMTWTINGNWYTMRAANTYNLSVLPKNASIQSAA